MNAQAKAPTAVTIAVSQDFEHFEFANDMFTHNPLTSEDPIAELVRFG